MRLPLRDNAVTHARARPTAAADDDAAISPYPLQRRYGHRRSFRRSENARNCVRPTRTKYVKLRAGVRRKRRQGPPLSRTSPGSAARHLLCRARTAAYGDDDDDDAVEILFITRRRHLFAPVHAAIVSVPGRNWSERKNLSIRAL